MTTARVILGCMLLAAPLLCAQQAGPATASAAARPASPPQSNAKQPDPKLAGAQETGQESYEIDIIFRRYSNGKRVTDRSYTLLATPGEILPAMRDDDHFRTSLADSADYVDHNIDVDILGLRRRGELMYVALKISTQNFDLDDPQGPPKLPVATTTHQYLVTPTIPIGKLVTVYAATQPGRSQEVQLEVKPFRADAAASE
jgi:hypothetical protein